MATYIYYQPSGESEVDTSEQGAEWLQSLIAREQGEEAARAFAQKFKAAQEKGSETRKRRDEYNLGPVFDLFVESSQDLFSVIPEGRGDEDARKVESFFALIFSMLLTLAEADHVDRATTRLCKIFTSNSQQQPELRLRLLMMLYNTFPPTVEFRCRVFKYILDYSAEAKLFDQVMPYLEYLDAWMEDWKGHINPESKRELYRDIATYMRTHGKRVDCFLYLKRYHQFYQGTVGPEVLKDRKVLDATVELLKDAVQIPSVIQFDDILAFGTVKALAKLPEHADLVKLCEVFYTGTVNDLRDFHGKHGKLFQDRGLDFQEAMSKIRLLTLASLANSRSEMTLAEIARGLEETEENAERWVVRAISEGVIDGRIDQLNRKVLVKSAFQRKFEKDEWAFLDGKLDQWINNLENVIKHIGQHKSQKEAAVTQAAAA